MRECNFIPFVINSFSRVSVFNVFRREREKKSCGYAKNDAHGKLNPEERMNANGDIRGYLRNTRH